jgi:hypothetical protein
LFDVLDVGELGPTSDVAVFASAFNLHNEFFHKRQFVAVFFPEMLFDRELHPGFAVHA